MEKMPPADIKVPAQQVDLGKGQVLGAHHDRHQEIAQHRGHGRNQEEEHHVHAVHGEQFVVSIGLEQLAVGREQVQPDQRCKQAANEEEERDGKQVQDRDPLVVLRQQPRSDSVIVVQEMPFGHHRLNDRCCGTHGFFPDGFAGRVPCGVCCAGCCWFCC